MIISCNECNSSFSVDDNLIKESGSKVRCSKCDSVFVAYPQSPETDEGDDLGLEDLDASMAELEDDDESFEVEGLTDDLSDELELDLDDFDDALGEEDGLEAAGLSDDSDGELELDLNLNDADDPDLDMSEDAVVGDELPDLGDFEDMAGLDDDALALDDTDGGLKDLDLNLSAETESDETDFELDGDQELDLADLDLEEDDEAGLEVEDAADSDDLDLDLDFDLDDDVQADEELAEAGAEIEKADELDLSDLELEMEDDSAADDTADAVSDDLNLDLDLEEETSGGEGVAEAGAEIEKADELDLSDLELEVEDASAADDTADAVSNDLNLDLDLDMEAEALAGAGETGDDELDLSDLEEIIDSDESPAVADAGTDAIEDLDLDLDLDTDPGAQTADAGATAEGDNELDISDLELMLETDDAPAGDDVGDELDLQFDIDEQPAAEGADASAVADISESAQDDDLLDIEKMLEGGDDATPDMESADEDLSLTMEAALDDAAKSAEDDLDLDFDIESELQEKEDLFDSRGSTDDPLESNLLDADDVDFLGDTGIEDESQQADVMTDEFATDEFSNTQGDYGATDVLPAENAEVPETPAAKPARSRSKKPVLAVLLLLILALGVIIIPKGLGIKIPYISDIQIPYLSDLDLKIPYLSDWLNPEEQDVSGNLKISPMGRTISAKFVNTAKAGRIFVIRGKIKNEYDHPRSFVKVTGKLYQGGKKLVKKSTVYIGNVIPESDLTGMDIAAINKRMKNKFGDKRSNLKIKTGKVVPFMIVFDKLPNNLDEYTVEVASSTI
ncbi:MAG: zinc-ribbon domain-containing protein [Proteobacteria bacterium]|nr:zinc-ribbon domain-containing protein [Pseudomonadota bacterium]